MAIPGVRLRDRASLIEHLRCGGKAKYLFFWGHEDGGKTPNEQCLSQWYPAPFSLDGVHYATAEQFMMAGKARLFGDEATLAEILAARHPRQAKALGRRVRHFDEARWVAARFDLVVAGSIAKFGQNPLLGEFLERTKERVLVEASPVDRIWGIGLPRDDRAAGDPERWRGENLLGFALMEARAALRTIAKRAERVRIDARPPRP